MIQKAIQIIIIGFLCAGITLAQQDNNPQSTYYRCYIGSSAFMAANLFENSNEFYQLNFGYRLTPKDVISLEAITWRFPASNGIPYGSSFGDENENYPGSIREYGLGIVYQRFLWKGLYTSLQALPLKRKYLDEDKKTIQNGFRLFSTLRVGYHIPLFKNKLFIEPSIAATYWPVSTNVPTSFKVHDDKWNKYFIGEPGLHFGYKF